MEVCKFLNDYYYTRVGNVRERRRHNTTNTMAYDLGPRISGRMLWGYGHDDGTEWKTADIRAWWARMAPFMRLSLLVYDDGRWK